MKTKRQISDFLSVLDERQRFSGNIIIVLMDAESIHLRLASQNEKFLCTIGNDSFYRKVRPFFNSSSLDSIPFVCVSIQRIQKVTYFALKISVVT